METATISNLEALKQDSLSKAISTINRWLSDPFYRKNSRYPGNKIPHWQFTVPGRIDTNGRERLKDVYLNEGWSSVDVKNCYDLLGNPVIKVSLKL